MCVHACVCVYESASVRLCECVCVEGYSLGIVKMEAFDDSHFMHQAVRVGHTDHTGSIVSLMVCIFDLKKKFLCNWKLVLL